MNGRTAKLLRRLESPGLPYKSIKKIYLGLPEDKKNNYIRLLREAKNEG